MAIKKVNETNETKSTNTETCKKKTTSSVACKKSDTNCKNASDKQPAKTNKTNVEQNKINAETKAKSTKAEKSKKPIYRVVYDKSDRTWKITKDGAKRTIASFVTKDEALARVKDLSESNDLNFIVHKKDGKFQKKK